jgi:hypothetical protein
MLGCKADLFQVGGGYKISEKYKKHQIGGNSSIKLQKLLMNLTYYVMNKCKWKFLRLLIDLMYNRKFNIIIIITNSKELSKQN